MGLFKNKKEDEEKARLEKKAKDQEMYELRKSNILANAKFSIGDRVGDMIIKEVDYGEGWFPHPPNQPPYYRLVLPNGETKYECEEWVIDRLENIKWYQSQKEHD